jgi:transposase InsO family protein
VLVAHSLGHGLLSSPTTVLSDNGSEFEADFAQLLEERGIKRWYTYPKTPKMNAHAERFNRTIQESFVDYHEELLFTDLALLPQARRLARLLQRRVSAPTPSASNPRYPSSCNIDPSAKGAELIHLVAALAAPW